MPGAGYENCKNVRRNNGKMVCEGSNTATLTLPVTAYAAADDRDLGPLAGFTSRLHPRSTLQATLV